jgi:hypothetical protein
MSLLIVPACDICSKPKGATNRWFVAFRRMPVKGIGTCRTVIFDWTMKLAQRPKAIHICGEGCISTFLSRDMENRTTEDRTKVKIPGGEDGI